jgi:hypothetical protein
VAAKISRSAHRSAGFSPLQLLSGSIGKNRLNLVDCGRRSGVNAALPSSRTMSLLKTTAVGHGAIFVYFAREGVEAHDD